MAGTKQSPLSDQVRLDYFFKLFFYLTLTAWRSVDSSFYTEMRISYFSKNSHPQGNAGHPFNVETRDFATTQSQFSCYPTKPTSDN